MIPDIDVSVGTRELSSKPDEDGENRIVNFELTLKLQMKFYENREAQILDDAYSTAMELEPVKEKMLLNKLIMKNQSSLLSRFHLKVRIKYCRYVMRQEK